MIRCVQNGEEYVVTVNGREIEVFNPGCLYIEAKCNFRDLGDETGAEFPENLSIDIDIEDEFDSFPFRQASFYRNDGPVILEFECDDSDTYWEDGSRMLAAIAKQLQYHDQIRGECQDDEDRRVLTVRTVIEATVPLSEIIAQAVRELHSVIEEAEELLSGTVWKREYEEDAVLFCGRLLEPLLRRMGFDAVRYHDVRDHGKDITFSEGTPFGEVRHYGLLAIAGDLSGDDDSTIDEVIEQVKDAFTAPWADGDAVESCYVSCVVVAISGRFIEDAKEKLLDRIPNGLIGSVVLMDQERLLECVEYYWLGQE